ncbi:Hypothetical_protein [Hexamita inflata]|uniref:Hypothetical_protein n=1 Tax=Hexamita inflata TaxID=28002 RepID=A0AA86RCM5_9EUKA|nr:Hypothetical protein HINF_LOCUS53918 [Hexamita inflata]CAI9970593.1 Hypothetical protein HINF_LOCUS58238 [Hexamita inflata]
MNKIKVRKFISHSLNCCLCQLCLAEIHLRCTITVSKEAMERLPLSNPEGSLMTCHQSYRSLIAAQHQWILPQPIQPHLRNKKQQQEPVINHTKQSQFSGTATSLLRQTRSKYKYKTKIVLLLFQI